MNLQGARMAERINLLVPAEVVPRLSLAGAAVGTTAAVPGGVYLRGVPVAVAEEWMARNPEVRAVRRRPAVRRFRPRFYTYTAVVFLVLAVQAIIVPAVDGVAEPLWLSIGGPLVLAGAGVTVAYKSIPFEHVRFAGERG